MFLKQTPLSYCVWKLRVRGGELAPIYAARKEKKHLHTMVDFRVLKAVDQSSLCSLPPNIFNAL